MINYMTGFCFSTCIGVKALINLPCQDQLVGKMINGNYTKCQRLDIDCQSNVAYYQVNGKTATPESPIVIVLESPHKSEFSNKIAQGPAMGKTGELFDKNFQELISGSILASLAFTSSHHVIIVNAVQYQCSLGKSLSAYKNKKTRDLNWIKCFNNKGSADLINRLEALNPYIIINLCTKGLSNLQKILCNSINKIVSNYTCGTHPSAWFSSYAKIF